MSKDLIKGTLSTSDSLLQPRGIFSEKVKLTKNSLELDPNMSADEWEELGHRLEEVVQGMQWYIGDWLNFGKLRFPNRYQEVSRIFKSSASKQTLYNWACVSDKIPPSRRRTNVAFSHYAAIASYSHLSEDQQEVLLDKAAEPRVTVVDLRHEAKKLGLNRATQTQMYGPPIDFRGLRHEPINEQGVVFLFGLIAKDLGYLVEVIQSGFPDCIAKRMIKPGRWQLVKIEFEFESRNFSIHKHSIDACDVIVCWRHNWPDCPQSLEVVELETSLKALSS